jgi:hypothetical protein
MDVVPYTGITALVSTDVRRWSVLIAHPRDIPIVYDTIGNAVLSEVKSQLQHWCVPHRKILFVTQGNIQLKDIVIMCHLSIASIRIQLPMVAFVGEVKKHIIHKVGGAVNDTILITHLGHALKDHHTMLWHGDMAFGDFKVFIWQASASSQLKDSFPWLWKCFASSSLLGVL